MAAILTLWQRREKSDLHLVDHHSALFKIMRQVTSNPYWADLKSVDPLRVCFENCFTRTEPALVVELDLILVLVFSLQQSQFDLFKLLKQFKAVTSAFMSTRQCKDQLNFFSNLLFYYLIFYYNKC